MIVSGEPWQVVTATHGFCVNFYRHQNFSQRHHWPLQKPQPVQALSNHKSTSMILKSSHTGWFKIILSTGQFMVHFLRVSEFQHWPCLLTPHGDAVHMHQWSFVCNLIDINAPHLSWNCNLLTLHPETSSLHRSTSMIKVCKPLRTWLNMDTHLMCLKSSHTGWFKIIYTVHWAVYGTF
jgi:hypothetical protein